MNTLIKPHVSAPHHISHAINRKGLVLEFVAQYVTFMIVRRTLQGIAPLTVFDGQRVSHYTRSSCTFLSHETLARLKDEEQ